MPSMIILPSVKAVYIVGLGKDFKSMALSSATKIEKKVMNKRPNFFRHVYFRINFSIF
jgi:hypothetical protein